MQTLNMQVTGENISRYAIEPATSPYAKAVSAWAERNRCWFIFGCSRRAPEGTYNTALIFNRAGASGHLRDRRPDVYGV